ncbi:MAG: hypothetical protein HYX24_02620 [Candidatus Aenigmarchaeota archaeon]|nr:hypothetical protein [Candidatus Aenigmarchaeota archaeon]
MKKLLPFFMLAISLAFLAYPVSADLDVQLFVSKNIYSGGERIELGGYVSNLSANSTKIPNANVTLNVSNSSGIIVANYTLTSSSLGYFFSTNDYYTSSTLVSAPPTAGNYTLTATYYEGTSSYSAYVVVYVYSNTTVDEILLALNKASYLAGEGISLTVSVNRKSGSITIPVPNIQINGTLRGTSDDSVQSSFNCTTDNSGKCYLSLTAPSISGNYYIEASNYAGFTTFHVLPFEVTVATKDDTATNLKDVFRKGETGYVEVAATVNGSQVASGTYAVSGFITDAGNSIIQSLAGFSLTANNSYANREQFSLSTGISSGMYKVVVAVSKAGGETINGSTIFNIRDWTLSFSKAASASGFEYGYVAFPNTTVYFEASPVDRATGATITSLDSNFTINVKNSLGIAVTNATANYNATCSCYTFNFTTPATAGAYRVTVSLLNSLETQTVERIITVSDKTATAVTTDKENIRKEIFTASEFVYIKPSMSNKTQSLNVTDVEIVSVNFEDGSLLNYSNASYSTMNFSDDTFQYAFNLTTGLVRVDPGKRGGQYIVSMYVNNRSTYAQVKFTIKPYDICTSAKASADTTSTSDYWFQFKTTDVVYLQLAVRQFQGGTNTSSGSGSSSGGAGGYGMGGGFYSGYGRGSQCTVSGTQQSVTNATLSIIKVTNTYSGRDEPLNTSASICQALSTAGTYICTIQANDSLWDGGSHVIVVRVTAPDGSQDTGYGFFESRAFYIYGWTSTWRNKPASNLTLTVNMYQAGSNWWSSNQGLSGTITLEKIEYYGKQGEWVWPPIKYNYNVTGMNSTAIGAAGYGTLSLPASRAPNGQWDSGSYNAVVKGVDEQGNVDYGRIWFEIRRFEAYATPVEIMNGSGYCGSGSCFRYKYLFNTRENISLYVKVNDAGSDYYSYGNSLGGNITIRVKKLEYYASWPPQEVSTSLYTANTLIVNQSNRDYYSASPATDGNYLLTINRTSGRWSGGYYNLVLDLNGTETGYGWFSAQAFYFNAQQVNENRTSVYSSRGRGPIYFNVSATKSQKWYGYYTPGDYTNATIVDLTLHTWSSGANGWTQTDYNYPENLNMTIANSSTLDVNSTQMLNVTYRNGTWPAGWYNGELTVRNSENETVTGYIYFNVQPFRVSINTDTYNIDTTDNVSGTIYIYEPDWSSSATINSNFTIDSILEERWSYNGYSSTSMTGFTPFTGQLWNGTARFNVTPNNGSWSGSGWKNLKVRIRDTTDNSTQDGWLSFRAVPFVSTINRASPYTIGLQQNVTVNVTLAKARTGVPTAGNISSVYYWGWPSKTYYNFSTGNCSTLLGHRSCMVNGSANVTITAPPGGWNEGYYYMYFTFTKYDDASSAIDDWNSVYFYARPSLTGYMHPVGDNGYWKSFYLPTENVTIYLYSVTNLNGQNVNATVSNVEYAKSSAGCWSDSCRTYQSASSWNVANITSGAAVSGNTVNGAGYIRIRSPSSEWSLGNYYVRITITSGSDSAILKNGYFSVKDGIYPNVTISSPSQGQNITNSFVYISAATTENANCYFYIQNYGNVCSSGYYYSNASYCNVTGFSGATYYWSMAGSWTSGMSTGTTAHSYNHSAAGMPNQDYVVQVYCYDSDYLQGYNAASFRLNVSSGASSANSSNVTFSSVSSNSTAAGSTVKFSAYLTAGGGGNVSGHVFSFDNGTGSFVNDSFVALSGNVSWVNVTKVINTTVGATIRWRVFANSSSGNISETGIQSFAATSSATSIAYSSLSSNSSVAGSLTKFSSYWTASNGNNLSGYVFSFDNGTGSFVNDSFVALSGNVSWVNVTKVINTTIGAAISWRVTVNASTGEINGTGAQSFNTSGNAPQWSSASISNTTSNTSQNFSVYWTDPAGLSGHIFSTNNTGIWSNDSFVAFTGTANWSNVTKTLNATANTTVGWRVWANNTNSIINSTSIQTLRTT